MLTRVTSGLSLGVPDQWPEPYLETANACNTDLAGLVNSLLVSERTITVPFKKTQVNVQLLPGRTFGGKSGPVAGSEVVIIGKMPYAEDTERHSIFSGSTMSALEQHLVYNKIDYSNWYLTNVCRFTPPFKLKTPSKAWFKLCDPLLASELSIVKPKYMLLLGSDAIRTILGPKYKLSLIKGTVLDWNGIQVMATINPAVLTHAPEQTSEFGRDIAKFVTLVKTGKLEVTTGKYVEITNTKHLAGVIEECLQKLMLKPAEERRVAIDCEWGSDTRSSFKNGQIRTVQFAIEPGTAYCVVLRRKDLAHDPATCCNLKEATELLKLLLCTPGIRLGGHNMRSDLLWLQEMGIDCADNMSAGFDTMLAYHLLFPFEDGHGLEQLTIRFTTLGRYDLDLEMWLKDNNCSSKEDKRRYGYSKIPEHILHPYGCADVDVVIQCWPILEQYLKDTVVTTPYTLDNGIHIATQHDLYTHIVHSCLLPLNEVEREGFVCDIDRCKTLTQLFASKMTDIKAALRNEIKWPDFNPRSMDQLREFLFGDSFKNKVLRPDGAVTLNCTPVKTTEKPARDWMSVPEEDIKRGIAMPSTDSETVKILAGMDPRAEKLLQFKAVDQIIKNFLRPPEGVDPETIFTGVNDDSEWEEGLLRCTDKDGRIRTNISQLTDTGRHRSYDINLQNLPKKQDTELKKIFSLDPLKLKDTPGWAGKSEAELKDLGLLPQDYYSIRSCLTVPPGYVMVEADYKRAELAVMAYLANDPTMIAIMSDPKRDMHSEMAITAFQLQCKPEEVPKLFPKNRILAKNVVFGIAYGRGAVALVRQAQSEGVQTTRDEMQDLIDNFFAMFPMVKAMIDRCHAAVITPGYVETAYGRRRYFGHINRGPTKNMVRKAREREAQNMPIQGTVADAINLSLRNLYEYRQKNGTPFHILLPFHDAAFLAVRWDAVEEVTQYVIPDCMTNRVTIPNTTLKIETDIATMIRWGEKLPMDQAIDQAKKELKK
jgi:uracil-DNA glycosylase family 4